MTYVRLAAHTTGGAYVLHTQKNKGSLLLGAHTLSFNNLNGRWTISGHCTILSMNAQPVGDAHTHTQGKST